MESINERFKKIIRESGLSQAAFARAIKRGRGEIANIVYGKTAPKENIIDSVCERFQISKNWLISGEGEMQRPMCKSEELEHHIGAALGSDSNIKEAIEEILISLKRMEDAILTIYENL